MANDIEKTTGAEHVAHHDEKKNIDASEIERVMTPDDDLKKDHQDYGRIDVCLTTTSTTTFY